ncbi:tubulin polyglutamylase TTLL4 [Sarcoptes scabiei]|nr:tubulin polyglutamylase TTLL4 [Sarcoptes scabiei]
MTDIFKRIAYLSQIQDLLNKQINCSDGSKISIEDSKLSESASVNNETRRLSMIKLNSFYGYLSKEIAMKRNVQILNCDPIKLFRCKRCFCQYDWKKVMEKKLIKPKTKRKFIKIYCPQCSYERKIIFRKQFKTKFEKLVFAEQNTTSDKNNSQIDSKE